MYAPAPDSWSSTMIGVPSMEDTSAPWWSSRSGSATAAAARRPGPRAAASAEALAEVRRGQRAVDRVQGGDVRPLVVGVVDVVAAQPAADVGERVVQHLRAGLVLDHQLLEGGRGDALPPVLQVGDVRLEAGKLLLDLVRRALAGGC